MDSANWGGGEGGIGDYGYGHGTPYSNSTCKLTLLAYVGSPVSLCDCRGYLVGRNRGRPELPLQCISRWFLCVDVDSDQRTNVTNIKRPHFANSPILSSLYYPAQRNIGQAKPWRSETLLKRNLA